MTGETPLTPTRAGLPLPADADALFRRERTAMLRMAVLLVGSRAEAEEAVQDGFAAIVARWETVDEPGGYLRTCVVNACRMVLRRREVERRHQAAPTAPQVFADDAPSRLVELHDALRTLSERERSAVVLRYFVDLPDDEIARMLECRPASVRSLVHRALAKLRKELT